MDDRPQHEIDAYKPTHSEIACERVAPIGLKVAADGDQIGWRGPRPTTHKDWRAKWRAARSMTWGFGLAVAALALYNLRDFNEIWPWPLGGSILEALAAWILLIAFVKMIACTHQPTRSIPWVD